MQFTVIDIETYFDQDYSLKKLTTEEYVRDPRFKIHCIAVKTPTKQLLLTENFAEQLKPFMDDFIICQHSQFDGLILSHHLSLYPKYWGCTLSMARAQLQFLKSHSLSSLCAHYSLNEKTIDYNAFKGKRELDEQTADMLYSGCVNDAELTYSIAQKLLESMPIKELQIIDATIRMFTEPCLELDQGRIVEELKSIRERKEAALSSLNVTKEDMQSSKKFGNILTSYGIELPMKLSPTKPFKIDKSTGEEVENYIPALAKTDEGMKELLEHENVVIAALAAARLDQKSTLMETRCERLLNMNRRGPLTVYLKYHGAHTGRWSGGDKVNFQNFPRGSEIRKSILAPEGFKLVGADASQIECRLLNWFCGQDNIVEAFATGRDIYCENATEFFGYSVTKAQNDERQFGKELELACGYNMGWYKFMTRVFQKLRMRLTEEESRKAINIYRNRHPKVCKMWRVFQEVIKNMGKLDYDYNVGCVTVDGYKIYMPDGTFLDYAGLYDDGDGNFWLGDTKVYGGLVVENIIQKLALIVVENAMINIDDKYRYKLATTTHDDVLYVVPENDNTALNNVLTEMKTPPEWCTGIPLNAEGFESDRYDK